MFASLLGGLLIASFFVKQPKASSVEGDLEALLARMRQRRYPETIPLLSSYWLKTVYASGNGRRHWKKLNRLLKRALGEQLPNSLPVEAARFPIDGGIPALAIGRALEGLLVRERLSPRLWRCCFSPNRFLHMMFTPRMRRSCKT